MNGSTNVSECKVFIFLKMVLVKKMVLLSVKDSRIDRYGVGTT